MIVLGLDTATAATVVGLSTTAKQCLQARDDPTGEQRPGHATRLLPLANRLLSEAKIGWQDIDRIAIGIGPGTFTGLRIGVATARGLAHSLDIELVGVASLRTLAYGAFNRREDQHQTDQIGDLLVGENRRGLLTAIDARRGEIFVAAYDGDVELIPAQPLSPNAIMELLGRLSADTNLARWVALGDGVLRYREAFKIDDVVVPKSDSVLHRIQAHAICALGAQAKAGERNLTPDYLRRPDAEIALEGASA